MRGAPGRESASPPTYFGPRGCFLKLMQGSSTLRTCNPKSRAPYSASSSDRSSAYVHQTQSWLAGPRGPVHNSTSFRLGLEITILGPSERQRWRNSTAVFRSLPPHPIPCPSRTPQDGVLGELGLTVLEGVLCERVSNGVASIHPGPVRGYRMNAAGMSECPRGPDAGSTQNCASSAGKQDY